MMSAANLCLLSIILSTIVRSISLCARGKVQFAPHGFEHRLEGLSFAAYDFPLKGGI
jgi:hypothetical protein